MAENTSQPTAKKKRRLRPSSSETVRERMEKASQQNPEKPKRAQREKKTRKLPLPARLLILPFRLIGKVLAPGFLRRSFQELRQVTWPKRRESRHLTTAVIIFSLAFGAFVWGLDYVINEIFKQVILNQ